MSVGRFEHQPVLVLDVDGVIIEGFPRRRWNRTLKEDLGIDPKHMQKRFFKPHWRDVLIGRVPVEEPLAAFLESCDVDVSVEDFIEYWHGRDAHVLEKVIEAALDWQRKTRGRLALATNQDVTRATYLRDQLDFGRHFEVMVVSCHVGVMKPEPEYFQKADVLLDRQPGQPVYFLDDLIDNVNGARDHGWNAHHVNEHRGAVEIIESLVRQA